MITNKPEVENCKSENIKATNGVISIVSEIQQGLFKAIIMLTFYSNKVNSFYIYKYKCIPSSSKKAKWYHHIKVLET